MSKAYVFNGKPAVDSNQPTAAYEGVVIQPAKPVRRCVALVPGSSTHMTTELSCLLRRRLRIAALIGLGAFALVLFKHLFIPGADATTPFDLGLHTVVVALLIAGCALRWSAVPLTWRGLRFLELMMFGSMGLYFGYVQVNVLNAGKLLEWAAPGQEEHLLSLGAVANGTRWLILMVLYGTFIPNTWKRCAVVVGCMTALPLLLTFGICFNCPIMGPHMFSALFYMGIVLAIGASVAIFGSYKISALQQQAYEARKMGQYLLKERLGAGGMGEVYLGEHVLLRRACAIKLIRPDQAGDPTNLFRFEREVQAMATLTHWNTVEVYDYGHNDDGTFYYVMEYLPGLSLQDLVDRHGPLPAGRTIHFLRQLCGALREAHGTGLIHRDIKPSNVIVCQRGGVDDVAKLLDFGLVQGVGLTAASDKLTIQGSILGSPPFISPEQALGKSQVDARTDIYSLGGLAYFLVTGQPPFVRETAMELLMAHVYDRVTSPRELRPEVPAGLEDVILRCLSKSPNERFADVAELDHTLADCADVDEWSHAHAADWWKNQRGAREPAFA